MKHSTQIWELGPPGAGSKMCPSCVDIWEQVGSCRLEIRRTWAGIETCDSPGRLKRGGATGKCIRLRFLAFSVFTSMCVVIHNDRLHYGMSYMYIHVFLAHTPLPAVVVLPWLLIPFFFPGLWFCEGGIEKEKGGKSRWGRGARSTKRRWKASGSPESAHARGLRNSGEGQWAAQWEKHLLTRPELNPRSHGKGGGETWLPKLSPDLHTYSAHMCIPPHIIHTQ